jgi:hypothetical protein
MSPRQKGYVTTETRCSQRKILLRITHTHAALCIHCVRFQGSLRPRRLCSAFCSKVIYAPRITAPQEPAAPHWDQLLAMCD